MRAHWSSPILVRTFGNEWESMPSTPGVYVVRTSRPIARIGGTDRAGILYVGRARNLRYRIWNFWKANHTASGFLWTHPGIARLVLSGRVRTVTDVENQLGNLILRYATPIHGKQIGRAERTLFFAYISAFGEAPPLNLSLSKRWDATPSASELRWAENGLSRNA